jgi:hypothetical protein
MAATAVRATVAAPAAVRGGGSGGGDIRAGGWKPADFPIGCRVAHVSGRRETGASAAAAAATGTVINVIQQAKRPGYGAPQLRVSVQWDPGECRACVCVEEATG